MSLKAETRQQLKQSILHRIDNCQYKPALICEEYGISRQTLQRYIKKLLEEGAIQQEGNSKPRIYKLVWRQQEQKQYLNEGLEESLIWNRDIVPLLTDINKTVYDKLEYIFCEMMNNAIEHSEAKQIQVFVAFSAISVLLVIRDNGVGIFSKIQKAMKLADKKLAFLELEKGKFTTDPGQHSGEGIFFSSKIADFFAIESDDLIYYGSNTTENPKIVSVEQEQSRVGTTVFAEVLQDSLLNIKDVCSRYEDPDTNGFNKTEVPVRMLNYGDAKDVVFVSRSQARRLLARFEKFDKVELDFKGVGAIRQGFADEIFRVFKLRHPDCIITYKNANEEVERTIRHVQETK